MNGQSRADYSSINPIKQVKVLENYEGYKRVLFIRAFGNSYLGYLDDQFFGFTVREEDGIKHWLMEVEDAIKYYKERIFFHIPSEEYNLYARKPEFKPYLNALNMVKDGKK